METARVTKLGNYRPLLVDASNCLWAARGYTLYRSSDQGASFDEIAVYNPGLAQRGAMRARLLGRLLRAGFHGLKVLPSGDIVAVVKGGIIRLGKGQRFFELVHRFERGNRPLNICMTPAGNIFYGEYWDNPDRDEVRIFGSFDNGRTWRNVHAFPRFAIRHVHGIHYDHYRDGCWILTGDSDEESSILFADSTLQNIETVARGSQKCRAVTVIPLQSGVVVPTDTEHEQNYVQWLDPTTGKLECIAPLPGTVFYSTKTRDRILLSTVVEPSHVNLSRDATIWSSSDGQNWQQIYARRKDHWSPVYFQYGTYVLAPSEGDGAYAFAGGQAIEGDDQKLLRIGFVDTV